MPETNPPEPKLFSVLVNDAKLEAIGFLRLLIADPSKLDGQPLSLIQHRRLAASAVLRLSVPRDSDFEYDPYTPEPEPEDKPVPQPQRQLQPDPDTEHPEVEPACEPTADLPLDPASHPETAPDSEPEPDLVADRDPQPADPTDHDRSEPEDPTADLPPGNPTAHAPSDHPDTAAPGSLTTRTTLRDRPNEPAHRAVPHPRPLGERVAGRSGPAG